MTPANVSLTKTPPPLQKGPGEFRKRGPATELISKEGGRDTLDAP